jgi:hypothetical protein
MKTQDIELKSLVGKHTLRAVYFDGKGRGQVFRFTLGCKHYEAVEDPCDDYRSCLERLSITKVVPKKSIKPVKVLAQMHPQESEILQFLNPKTKLCILEIGTTNADEYYPGFIAEFHPENI